MLWDAFRALCAVYVVYRAYIIWKALRAAKGVPIQFTFLQPLDFHSNFFPSSRWNPGMYYIWDSWRVVYARGNFEAILFVPLLQGEGILYTASPEAYRQILHGDFDKFEKTNGALAFNILGANLVASDGPTWKRHRRITAPAFNQQTYSDVWDVTSKLYHQMLNTPEWRAGDELLFSSFNTFTTRVALLVIAATGFNIHLNWDESPSHPDLHMPIDEMIVTVSSNALLKIIFPRWLFSLPNKFLRKIQTAYEDFERYLHAAVAQKTADLAKQAAVGGGTADDADNRNVFARLVQASVAEGAAGLDASELTGNLFIFMFAGHETTAHTLVVTLALLAAHPAEQDKVFRHIQDTIGDRAPTFQDYAALAPVLHPFYEALRLYPAAYIQLRNPKADTVLRFVDPDDHTRMRDVPLVGKTRLILDQIGMNRNPRIHADPDAFKPERWEGSSADDLLAFSAGPRVCLGKKFALVEATCFLTHLLQEWRVELDLKGVESVEAWQERFLYPVLARSLKTGDVPLRLVRRLS